LKIKLAKDNQEGISSALLHDKVTSPAWVHNFGACNEKGKFWRGEMKSIKKKVAMEWKRLH